VADARQRTPKPGDANFDWSTYAQFASDPNNDPVARAKGTLAHADAFEQDYLKEAAPKFHAMEAAPRPDVPVSLKQITDTALAAGTLGTWPAAEMQHKLGNDGTSMALGLAGIIPAYMGGAAAAIPESAAFALSGARKLLNPEAGESRVGGAFEAGLGALGLRQPARRLMEWLSPSGGSRMPSILSRSKEVPYQMAGDTGPAVRGMRSADEVMERVPTSDGDLADAMGSRVDLESAGFSKGAQDKIAGRPVVEANLSHAQAPKSEPTFTPLSQRPAHIEQTMRAKEAATARPGNDYIAALQDPRTPGNDMLRGSGVGIPGTETLPALAGSRSLLADTLPMPKGADALLEELAAGSSTPDLYARLRARRNGSVRVNPVTGLDDEVGGRAMAADAPQVPQSITSMEPGNLERTGTSYYGDVAPRVMGGGAKVEQPAQSSIMQQLQDSLAERAGVTADPPNLMRGADEQDIIDQVYPPTAGRGRAERKYGQSAAEAMQRLQQEHPSLGEVTDPLDFLRLESSNDPFKHLNRAAEQPSLAMLADLIRSGAR
jgi:hypothetical protein